MDRIAFYPPSIEEAASRLETALETGLSDTAAQQRLDRYGPNSIVERRTGPRVRFLSYFRSYFRGPIPATIKAAAPLSAAARQWEDFAIILAMPPRLARTKAIGSRPAAARSSCVREASAPANFRGFGK